MEASKCLSPTPIDCCAPSIVPSVICKGAAQQIGEYVAFAAGGNLTCVGVSGRA